MYICTWKTSDWRSLPTGRNRWTQIYTWRTPDWKSASERTEQVDPSIYLEDPRLEVLARQDGASGPNHLYLKKNQQEFLAQRDEPAYLQAGVVHQSGDHSPAFTVRLGPAGGNLRS